MHCRQGDLPQSCFQVQTIMFFNFSMMLLICIKSPIENKTDFWSQDGEMQAADVWLSDSVHLLLPCLFIPPNSAVFMHWCERGYWVTLWRIASFWQIREGAVCVFWGCRKRVDANVWRFYECWGLMCCTYAWLRYLCIYLCVNLYCMCFGGDARTWSIKSSSRIKS